MELHNRVSGFLTQTGCEWTFSSIPFPFVSLMDRQVFVRAGASMSSFRNSTCVVEPRAS